MTDISGHLEDPGAVSQDDAIFSGGILRLDVNFRPKISRRPKMSRRLTAPRPWVSQGDLFSATERAYRAAGQLLEPTVREDDQQFPSQIQDGGR